MRRAYRASGSYLAKGDPGDALYAVVSGTIRISAGAADGREIFLNIMEPGDTFGEIALLDGGTRTASAARDDRIRAGLDPAGTFPRIAPNVSHGSRWSLLRLCGERLRWTSGLVEDAARCSMPRRDWRSAC